ncbi:YcxB family protein [Microbacterium sp. Au-Mic1]|uniref:YcxB family protein n=1 Tax=Microbacterium sp. Au-Mic1 TaxID=2906457 RepID=UPI001E45DF8E|nr:YcxB family protein [Microbacterium sp. Au-Mic1]MCE4026911.1 YcxB family protein [Microbacterium sp. Au-Mic1]
MDHKGELDDAEYSGAHAGVVIDADIQEHLVADLRHKLTEDAKPAMVLFGAVGFVSLLALIGLYRDLIGAGTFWLVLLSLLMGVLIPIRIVIQLRNVPRKAVSTSYPIGSRVDAGTDNGYVWHSAALGSARTMLSVYDKVRVTADSVMLKHASSPTTIILPRAAFTEEDIRTLEEHFAPKNRS